MIRSAAASVAAFLVLVAPRAEASPFWKPFIAGAASAFVIHEGSHLILDLGFRAEPRLKGVRFGPLPFFAVTHRSDVSPGREALISGAGFLSQHVTSEVVLQRGAPNQPISAFSKGALAFHVATSVAYAGAALARYGPYERDTRGLATATGTDERLIGVLVLAPAAFDAWRYLRPTSKAARWGSRAAKIAFLDVIALKR